MLSESHSFDRSEAEPRAVAVSVSVAARFWAFNKRTGGRILLRGLADYEGLETCDTALGRDGNKRTGCRIIERRFIDCEVLTAWEARISINDRRLQNKS